MRNLEAEVASTGRQYRAQHISMSLCERCELVNTVNVEKNKFFVHGRAVLINSTTTSSGERARGKERREPRESALSSRTPGSFNSRVARRVETGRPNRPPPGAFH